jgi:nudix-type nucleoside diphosphatase (YffH/AdpP family)
MTERSGTVRIRKKDTLARGKGTLMRVTYEHFTCTGEWRQNTREVYDNGDSAVVLPYDPKRNTVLLTRQLRIPAYLQAGVEKMLEACAGKLEGKDAEQRIVKEIEEELGYRIPKVERLFELFVSPAAVMEKVTFFTCAYSPDERVSAGGGLADEGEDIEVVEVPFGQALSWVEAGVIMDAKTVILVQVLRDRL